MQLEDLIQLLNNRLREFQLSRDYARMIGNLESMNAADKEILALEDTLYQLNLLVDTSKSAAVKEGILAEIITNGSVAVLGEYDISLYATDPLHEEKIMNILSKMDVMDTVEKIDDHITRNYLSSPVTGAMVMNAAEAYAVDVRLMMAIMEQDSSFGTAGLAVRTLNPGNVGNDDDGNIRTYGSWQEGVTAVAEWLSRHRIQQEIPKEIIVEPIATTTPEVIIVPETNQDGATTTTQDIPTETASTTPETSATSTPETAPTETASTTPETAPTETASTTPETSATSTPETAPTETASTTPETSTPETAPTETASTTPEITPENTTTP